MTGRVVYRFENDAGDGPYRGGCLGIDSSACARRPLPCEDGVWKWGEATPKDACKYGFTSLEHLAHWFDFDELDLLEFQGFSLRKFLVKPGAVWEGRSQCAFDTDGVLAVEDYS